MRYCCSFYPFIICTYAGEYLIDVDKPTAGTASCNGSACTTGWYKDNVTITTIARFPYDFFMPRGVRLFLNGLTNCFRSSSRRNAGLLASMVAALTVVRSIPSMSAPLFSFTRKLQKQAMTMPKYSFGWFKALLEMESLNSGEVNSSSKEVSISFAKVEREPGTKRTLVLKYPSRYIPQFMEDLADIPPVLAG